MGLLPLTSHLFQLPSSIRFSYTIVEVHTDILSKQAKKIVTQVLWDSPASSCLSLIGLFFAPSVILLIL